MGRNSWRWGQKFECSVYRKLRHWPSLCYMSSMSIYRWLLPSPLPPHQISLKLMQSQTNNWNPTDTSNFTCSKIQASSLKDLLIFFSTPHLNGATNLQMTKLKVFLLFHSPIKWNRRFYRFHFLTIFCKHLAALSPLRFLSLLHVIFYQDNYNRLLIPNSLYLVISNKVVKIWVRRRDKRF